MIAMSNPILTEKTLVRLGVNDLGCAVKVDHSFEERQIDIL